MCCTSAGRFGGCSTSTPRRSATVLATWHDVTERIRETRVRERLRAEERARREQLTFLDDTATAFMKSLDVDVIAQQLAETLVPALGDLAIVLLEQPGVPCGKTFVAHVRPDQVAAVRGTLERDAAAQGCLQDIVAHGEIVEWPRVVGEDGTPADDNARRFRLTAALGANSAFLLPLPARDAVSGALAVLHIEARPPVSASDVTLARLVALRAALAHDNARLYGELQAALIARDARAASVTHDLQSPLGMIRLGVQSAAIMLGDALVTDRQQLVEAQDALKQVDDVAVRMDSFIQELLDLAVLESGTGLTLNRGPIDLRALVRAAVAAQALAGRAVNLDAPSGPIVGRWDRLRLQRVIGNLLSNAAKAPWSARSTSTWRWSADPPVGGRCWPSRTWAWASRRPSCGVCPSASSAVAMSRAPSPARAWDCMAPSRSWGSMAARSVSTAS
jgi:signal transduction histidine kinase